MKTAMVVAAVCILVAASAIGQTTNATLSGTVNDTSGALIPGVSIKATNIGTGIVSTTLTNEAGAYNFASLQTGTYTITVELAGFQTQTLTNFALGLSQQVRQNFTLQVASVGTNVEVSVAADTALATTSSSVGTVLPEFQLRELPTGDRNVMELLRGVGGTGPTEGVIDGFFGGNRTSAVNVTRDGFTVGAGRYDRRFKEHILAPDIPVYVLGTTIAGGGIGAAPRGAKVKEFLITYKSEAER